MYKRILFLLALILLPNIAFAQGISINIGENASSTNSMLQLLAALTILSVAPGILLMVTGFTRIIVILAILRNAIGLQQTPSNMIMVSLALFITFFVMKPTFEEAWDNGINPYMMERITEERAIEKTIEPFKKFMYSQVDQTSLRALESIAEVKEPSTSYEDVDLISLMPAFLISELKRAFEIGFLIFVPFLVIDMVIAAILMSMGMMMMSPMIVSLPFKIIFFVLIDGWALVTTSIVRGFGV